MEPQPKPLRLNKFLAERLGLSRREADEVIRVGKVTINSKKAELGARVDKNDEVCYNGNIVPFQTDFLYLIFHKPVGYVCSRRAQGSTPTIYDLLPQKYHNLKTVGRLDKDSSGLIILTNDGDFAFSMTHPKFRKTKVYEVELDKPLEPLHQQMITDFGVEIGDGPSKFKIIKNEWPLLDTGSKNLSTLEPTRPPVFTGGSFCRQRLAGGEHALELDKFSDPKSPNCYTVILTEGRNRQIRRTFAALGYEVTKLHRTEFGPYELKGLKPGQYQQIPTN